MRLGLQTFSDGVTEYFDLNDYQNKLDYLNAMTLPFFLNGRTNTAGELKAIHICMNMT